MLAEFKYGLVPKESFADILGDQSKPSGVAGWLYYRLKKDFFPWVYFNYMVKGQWFGSTGLSRPKYE